MTTPIKFVLTRNGLKSFNGGLFVNAQFISSCFGRPTAERPTIQPPPSTAILPPPPDSSKEIGQAGHWAGRLHQQGLFMHSSYHNGENPKVVRMNAI